MPTPTHSLSRHLLKRSDFELLGVPTAQVVRWLGKGWLEQIGNLPIDDPNGDAVFAIADPALRADLTQQLQGLGKTEVVVSPMRSRSLLLRCSLLGSPRPQDHAQALADELAGTVAIGDALEPPVVPRDLLAEVFRDPRVVEALAEEAQAIVAEVNQLLSSAREAARLDLLDAASAAAAETPTDASSADEIHAATPAEPEPAAPQPAEPEPAGPDHEPPAEADPAEGDDGDGDFFDADDLFETFGNRQSAVRAEAAAEPPTPLEAMPLSAPDTPSPLPAAEDQPVSTADLAVLPTAEADQPDEPDQPDQPDQPDEPDAPIAAQETSEPLSAAAPSHETVLDPRPTEAELDELLAPSDAVTHSAEFGGEPVAFHETATTGTPATTAGQQIDTAPAAPAPEPEPAPAESDAIAPQPSGIQVDSKAHVDAAPAALTAVTAFLGELRQTLVELAQRHSAPPPAPAPSLDVQPLVLVMHEGLAQTREHTASQAKALGALEDRLGQLGKHLEQGVALAVHAAIANQPKATTTHSPTVAITTPAHRQGLAMLALCVLLVGWSAVLWFKTGNARLALGTLVAANAIGCAMLLGRRR